ncbi:MAG: SDR family oxidoreductase [Bacteroidota bacterium]|nr:SDR family oxidoreductase [Bacteroidota bacterium]
MANYLIVGGTKGIGLETVRQLNQAGHHLWVVAREVNEALPSSNLHFLALDITKETISADFLPEVLDGVVYAPGSINLKPFNRLSQEDFLNDWQVNVLGAIKTLQTVLPMLKKSDSASVVLFSTVAVSLGMPFHASIAASKGAIEGLTKSLAAEFSPKIRVNCIAPSLTNTPLAEKLLNTPEKIEASGKRHPLQRVGNPKELAEMACFLLSNSASWMTGQILHLDGGMSSIKI